jgi:hypothetical protein
LTLRKRAIAWLGRLLERAGGLFVRWAEKLGAGDATKQQRAAKRDQSRASTESQLEAYGRPLFTYRGEGTLRWAGDMARGIAFEVGQYPNGRIVLAGLYGGTDFSDALLRWAGGRPDPSPEAFEGVAENGVRLRSVGGVMPTNYLPKTHAEGEYDAFRLQSLECEHDVDPASTAATQHRFGLVNFHFHGTRRVTVERSYGTHYLTGLPVTLRIGSASVDAFIVPVADSDHLHRMVMTQKTSAVLAELIVDSAAVADADELAQAVSDLCLVLSVMRGTKVQWIYRQDWHGQQVIKTTHRAGLTKAYSPLAPLGYEYESASDSERFVQAGVVALSTSPILQADRTVIDAYLDAKVEHDFLETRAAKVALALEKLKQVCLQTGAMAVGEFEADQAVFRSVVPAMVSAALPLAISGGIPAAVAKRIISESKLGGLNRTSFRQVVKALLSLIVLKVPTAEQGLFIACRNSLVHVGRFYCDAATAEQRANVQPLATPFEEYCFMISFLDRIFLKIFGYSGKYFDWRDFPNEGLRRDLE